MIFYFSPSKLFKKDTKEECPTHFSSSSQQRTHTDLTVSLSEEDNTQDTPKTENKSCQKNILSYHNVAEYGQLTPSRHDKGNIYQPRTTLSFGADLKSEFYPMTPPKQRDSPQEEPNNSKQSLLGKGLDSQALSKCKATSQRKFHSQSPTKSPYLLLPHPALSYSIKRKCSTLSISQSARPLKNLNYSCFFFFHSFVFFNQKQKMY